MKFACELSVFVDCSYEAKYWVDRAIGWLPSDVVEHLAGRLAIVCVDSSDGRRLTSEFCQGRQLIILSERIVPRGCLSEDDSRVRYFIFVVMHEIAHAICDHQAPRELPVLSAEGQEDEADVLAYKWLNEHLETTDQPRFSTEELSKAKAESKRVWEKAFGTATY